MSQLFDIVVIALPSEKERRANIDSQFSKLDARFSFFDAFPPPADIDEARELGYQPEAAKNKLKRQLSLPEVACFASHREVWRRAAENGRPVFVMESDASINHLSVELINHLCTEKHGQWEMVMFNYHKCIPSFWKRKPLINGMKLVKFANRRAYCFSSYLLSPEAGEKLSRNSENFFLPADDFACGSWIDKGIDLYAVFPRGAGLSEHAEESTLEEHRQKKNTKSRKKNKKSLGKRMELPVRNFFKKLRPPKKGL